MNLHKMQLLMMSGKLAFEIINFLNTLMPGDNKKANTLKKSLGETCRFSYVCMFFCYHWTLEG